MNQKSDLFFKLPKYGKEETIERLEAIVARYNQNDNFILKEIKYKDHLFGDILLELDTKSNLHFTIIRDRFVPECTIDMPHKRGWTFDIEDVLAVLARTFEPVPTDMDITEAADRYMQIITDNLSTLEEAFNKKNKAKTIKMIDNFLNERLKKHLNSR